MTLSPDEKESALRLAQRARKCAELCAELIHIDPFASPIGRESSTLAELTVILRNAVDSGNLRFGSCLRLLDTICDLQEEGAAERKLQLARHSKQ